MKILGLLCFTTFYAYRRCNIYTVCIAECCILSLEVKAAVTCFSCAEEDSSDADVEVRSLNFVIIRTACASLH